MQTGERTYPIMSIKRFAPIGLVALIVLAVAGFAAFNLLTTNNTAPSGALTAIPVVISTATPAAGSTPVVPVATASSVSVTAASGTASAATTVATSDSGLVVYQIDPSSSKVSFTITENLNGQPNTVVGTTNLVAGQLALNAHDLSQTRVGVIQVDARGLTTDNDRRNGAIRNFILNTDQFEYITFTPKSVSGLTGTGQAGQPYTFQLTGDLTIRNVTQSVTFDVTAQGAAADQISGTAKTTINRSDYSLTIPSVPNVANVGEQVTLQIDFLASAAG
jgi:polyisoprenoid-binding protein YceI